MNVTRLGAVVEAGSSFDFRPVIFLGLVSALVVQAQEALPSIQFNVPYRCADGTAYVIQRCESGAKGEVCFFHVEANGQRESDRYMARAQFTDMMKRCPVSSAPKPAVQPARGGSALNPAYLSEMPSVDRVLREMTAGDAQEIAARQMGALIQLGRIVTDMRGGRTDFTPDEQATRQRYIAARAAIQNRLQEANLALALRGYDNNPAFREELLNRFFSPAFHAQYDRTTAETNARIQAPVSAAATATAAPRAPAVARNDSRTPAKPAVTAVGPPDLGIAKARAANVDTKLFGIPMGEPLAIPKCTGGLFETPSTNCFETHEILEGLAAAIMGVKPEAGEPTEVTIQLTPGNCPTWMDACSFNATIQNGRLVAARLGTKGRDVEAAVGKELRGKYGQRASMQQRFITPNNGGANFEVWDLDWELPGLHVEYKVVNATILDGYVGIESETIYAVRKAKDREAAKPKL